VYYEFLKLYRLSSFKKNNLITVHYNVWSTYKLYEDFVCFIPAFTEENLTDLIIDKFRLINLDTINLVIYLDNDITAQPLREVGNIYKYIQFIGVQHLV